MIDLNPSIIDQDAIRKKRRKKMLLIAAAPLSFVTLVAVFFARPGLFDLFYGMNFYNSDAGSIVMLSDMQKAANLIEPYIAHYSSGTALIRDGQFKRAEDELRESIKNNPPKDTICKVRVNLSYSIEMQADEAKNNQQYSDALILYSRAEGILYEDDCASASNSSQDGNDERATESEKRIAGKRGEVTNMMNGNSDPNGQGNSGEEGPSMISGETIEQAQQRVVSPSEVLNTVNSSRSGYINYGVHW